MIMPQEGAAGQYGGRFFWLWVGLDQLWLNKIPPDRRPLDTAGAAIVWSRLCPPPPTSSRPNYRR